MSGVRRLVADGGKETRLGVIGRFRLRRLAGDVTAQAFHLGNIGKLGDDAAQPAAGAADRRHLDTRMHELRLTRLCTGLEAEFSGCPVLALPQQVEGLHASIRSET